MTMLSPALTPLHSLLSSSRPDEYQACHNGERFVPWREFAGRVAARTAQFKACTETRWLLASDDPQNFAISLLALLHAGKQVAIPPNTQPGTLAQLADTFDTIVSDEVLVSHADPASLQPIDPHTAIIDLYTSGSTGQPKLVRKTLAQFEAEIEALETLWGTALGHAVITATAPHHHIYGLLFRLLWPLSAGRTFDTVTCAHPDTLSERLALLGDTVLVSSPAQLSRLPELIPLTSLTPAPRLIFSSGGPLPAVAATEFHRQLGQAPTEIFGSTETGGIAWRRHDDDDAWTPLPGITVSCGSDRALSLSSPFLADTAPWRMDDAIELLPNNRFRLCGRLDRVVKIEEKRLSLPDMESRLATHPWVATSATVPLAGRRQSVGAAVVLTPEGQKHLITMGRRDTAKQLRLHLAAHFEAVLLPRRWRFPEQLPINEREKLTHAALTALFTSAEDAPITT